MPILPLDLKEPPELVHHHRGIDTQPILAQVVLKQRIDILNWTSVSHRSQRNRVWTNEGEGPSKPHPERIILSSNYGANLASSSQALGGGETDHGDVSKKIHTLVSRDPQIPLSVLVDRIHVIAGQALRCAVVIRMAVMDVVEALRLCSDPKSLIAVQKESYRSNSRAIESGDHIAREASITVVAHSQPRPHAIHGHPD